MTIPSIRLSPPVDPEPRPVPDRGSVTTLFAVLAVFFFAIVSLVAEGSRKLTNLSLAEDLAAEAARAAAATLDANSLVAGVPTIDLTGGRAQGQAERVIATVPGASLEYLASDGTSVEVLVRVSARSWIPGFDLDVVGRHRALAIDPNGAP